MKKQRMIESLLEFAVSGTILAVATFPILAAVPNASGDKTSTFGVLG